MVGGSGESGARGNDTGGVLPKGTTAQARGGGSGGGGDHGNGPGEGLGSSGGSGTCGNATGGVLSKGTAIQELATLSRRLRINS